LKSVFIIAIVAVAMIGMIVPSVFANHLKYDEYGNVTESIDYVNGDLSNTTKYKYKYDASKNWTMLTLSSDKLNIRLSDVF